MSSRRSSSRATGDSVARESMRTVREVAVTHAAVGLTVLCPPYVLMVAALIVGWVLNHRFGPEPWSLVGQNLITMLIAFSSWHLSRSRSGYGRYLTAGSALAGGTWVMAASAEGVNDDRVLWLWICGGIGMSICWNVRSKIRAVGEANDMAPHDVLATLFSASRESAGMKGATMRTKEITGRKVSAVLQLEAGEQTVDDAQSKRARMESAMGLPPGAMIITADENDASRANVAIVEPRTLRYPVAWPGPYLPGHSIAHVLRTGVWADGEDLLHGITGHHIQVMGMSGSGKSEGCMWNYMAEIISRKDAVVFGLDVTKGSQFFGPFARKGREVICLETKIHRVTALIDFLSHKVKERTEWLGEHGFTKWEENCGLDYWILWLEECPEIWNELPSRVVERLCNLIKAIRSAGGTVVLSLQRSDFNEMPTIARGQLANMTFGVANGKDAIFGLSEAQIEAGASPELWGTRNPGMLYLDVPGLDADRIAMPARTFNWNSDLGALDEHVQEYGTPLNQRQLDPFTTAVLEHMANLEDGNPHQDGKAEDPDGYGEDMANDEEIRQILAEVEGAAGEELDDMADDGETYQVRHEDLDPDPDVTDGVDETTEMVNDPELEAWTFTANQTFNGVPESAKFAAVSEAIRDRIGSWKGGKTFRISELTDLWAGIVSRQWVGKQMTALSEAGVIAQDDHDARVWRVLERQKVGV